MLPGIFGIYAVQYEPHRACKCNARGKVLYHKFIEILCNFSSGHFCSAQHEIQKLCFKTGPFLICIAKIMQIMEIVSLSRPLSTSSERNPTDAGIHAHDSWNLCEISFVKRVLCYLCWRSFHVFQRRAFFPLRAQRNLAAGGAAIFSGLWYAQEQNEMIFPQHKEILYKNWILRKGKIINFFLNLTFCMQCGWQRNYTRGISVSDGF